MPPTAKPPTKNTKGKDIRGFFGGNAKSTPSSAPNGSEKSTAIEISDDDGPKPTSKKVTLPTPNVIGTKPKSERVMEEDVESDFEQKPVLKRKKPLVLASSDEEEVEAPPPKKAAIARAPKPTKSTTANSHAKSGGSTSKPKTTLKKKKGKDDDFVVSDDAEESSEASEGEGEDEEVLKKGKGKTVMKKATAPPKKPVKVEPKPSKESKGDTGTKDDVDAQKPKPKVNWAAKAAKMAGPAAPGSKPVPTPKDPDCLSGLSFVFTGELTAFSRDEAVELAKRFGGRVVGQPSSKTSYVVLGADAGPSKLAAIKKNNLKTLDEDGFLQLIATRVPNQNDEALKKKRAKEQEAIKVTAKEMEKREKTVVKDKGEVDVKNQLWTDRYAPRSLKEICGNKGQVEKLQSWLHDWSNSLKSGFKKPGKSGMNVYRAVLITGPPGIGKTTSAHLCAKLEGFTPIELNASDARSKKLVENSTNVLNTSLDGWMGGGSTTNAAGVAITDKSCLIMDEVDGMSAGDRGGVGALVQLVKKSKIPIICIANDGQSQKLKPLMSATFKLPFRRPEVNVVRSRILSIAYKEKLKIPANVIDQLVQGSQSDIRQVLNMLSTWKLSSDTMDFDEGKTLSKMNEKYTILSPFDVTYKMLGPYLFSATARETLGDKMELYFHDLGFMPLFIQENYLKTTPSKLKNDSGPEKELKHLRLMDKAASSISDGDLVDSLIHGPEQHWSLMPLHAVCSTIRPASFLFGMGGGYGSPNPMGFPQWLGQNSKQGKLGRQLTDIQARMRLKVSANKSELRESYLPALFPYIVKPLMDEGSSAVDDVIDRMDDYFLNRDDWDTIIELGLDEQRDDLILKKISTQTKTALTRKYNSKDHPVAFHKAVDLGKAPKKIAAAGPAPDLEEAFEVDEEIAEEPEDNTQQDDDDISKDSLIKVPKGKAKMSAAKGSAAGGAGKAKAASKPKAKKS